mmetsp:Transcript_15113/g.37017  ORF Transcript_15113/g.37017 Transcript_15113/m.37017 type:complete len:96 (-) Transcript_15113:1373-1660(-)
MALCNILCDKLSFFLGCRTKIMLILRSSQMEEACNKNEKKGMHPSCVHTLSGRSIQQNKNPKSDQIQNLIGSEAQKKSSTMMMTPILRTTNGYKY